MTFPSMNRRTLLSGTAMAALGAAGALGLAPGRALALGADASTTLIGAAWRGPKATDTHYAGVLAADWERKKLSIRYAVALPSRPHGLLPQAEGRDILATSMFMIMTGLALIVMRSRAIMQMIGLITLENGIYLLGLIMTEGLPLIIELGIFLDVLIAVVILVILTSRLRLSFKTTDTNVLDKLKG